MVQAVPSPSQQELVDYYMRDYREGICAGLDVADPVKFPKDNLFYFNRGQSVATLVCEYFRHQAPHVLDIGAGYGHILHAIGERFPNCTRIATEFSEPCIEHLESLGIHIVRGTIEAALEVTDREFDMVIISHVFEHLLDPKSVAESVYHRLAPGGIMYIEVPHIPAEPTSRCPDHVWAPRFDEPHIGFFTPKVLRGLLEDVGFKVEFCDTAGPMYTYISPWRYRMPTMRWLVQGMMPAGLFHFLRSQKFTKPLRVSDRDESFYQYGGPRIWIRSISRKMPEAS